MNAKTITIALVLLVILAGGAVMSSDRATAFLGIGTKPSERADRISAGPAVELKDLSEASGVARFGRLFVVGDSYSVSKSWRASLEKNLPGVEVVYSSRGGSSLADQVELVKERNRLTGWPLLIMDGGLTDRYPVDEIRAMVGAQQPQCDMWFYVEPVRRQYDNAKAQKGRNRQHERLVSELQSGFPDHLIEWISELSQEGDGSVQDAVDLENMVVPRSLRKDKVHLNDKGYEILGTIVARELMSTRLANSCA
ncbi:SGNH/GDSL hydrolase family protein [Qipengyuania sp. DSG2-2]|uniref:SGNH/GDSL hydrolase family protein n=1 Tax=Qipengyuania sp. DGS2-2 TaxID=3349631 RepID=UPI0036D3A784